MSRLVPAGMVTLASFQLQGRREGWGRGRLGLGLWSVWATKGWRAWVLLYLSHIHTYIHTHTYTHTYIHSYIYILARPSPRLYVHLESDTYTHKSHIYTPTPTPTHEYTHTYTYITYIHTLTFMCTSKALRRDTQGMMEYSRSVSCITFSGRRCE